MKNLKLFGLSLLCLGCSANWFNKPRSELTPFEGFTRDAAILAIKIGANRVCATGDPGLRNEILLTLAPLKQYAEDNDLDGLMAWAANTGLDKLDAQTRNDLYPIVQEALNNLAPCKLAPTSLECKNLWTNAYGQSLKAVIDGCYTGALMRGTSGGVGSGFRASGNVM